MKTGIDTFGCDSGKSGIGTYLSSLVKNLPAQADTQFELFGSESDRFTYVSETAPLAYSAVQIKDSLFFQRLWHIFSLKSFIKKSAFDVVFYPSGARMLPAAFKTPGVLAVNDLPSNLFAHFGKFPYRPMLLTSLRRATKIIAASQFIRKNLVGAGVKADKIEVIYNGIDHSLFYPRDLTAEENLLIQPFSIKRPYLLYPSRITYPSKKHVELIRAFEQFKKNTGLPHRLVLAGADGPDVDLVKKELLASPYVTDIMMTGFFPQKNFPLLYAGADACVFPSVSEGVGLPVLEAMSTGIPVICAKAGALPEVAGDNALYFDPDNVEEFALTIELAVLNRTQREKMIQGGLDWTKRFSWEKTVQKTLEVLEAAAREKS